MDGSIEGGAPPQAASAVPALPRGCPHCRGVRLQRWGVTRRGLARLRCGGCRRTFSLAGGTLAPGSLASGTLATGFGAGKLATGTFAVGTFAIGTFATRLRRRAAFEAVLEDMFGAEPSSCRRLAARLGLHHMTVWRWRIRILAHGMRRRPPVAPPPLPCPPLPLPEVGGVVLVRESRKASREWVRHERWPAIYPPPPRPRWHTLAPGEVPPGGWSAWRVALDLRGRSDGLQTRFGSFLARFRGPATRYLAGYAAWMEMREALQVHGGGG